MQRNTFTSNQNNSVYSSLDTDFIVGTAILYFEKEGYSCERVHISDEPTDENKFVKEQQPVLQNATNAKIKDDFRMKKGEKDYWKRKKNREGVTEAETGIFSLLDIYMRNRYR